MSDPVTLALIALAGKVADDVTKCYINDVNNDTERCLGQLQYDLSIYRTQAQIECVSIQESSKILLKQIDGMFTDKIHRRECLERAGNKFIEIDVDFAKTCFLAIVQEHTDDKMFEKLRLNETMMKSIE